jgi:hypothetical protein
LLMSMILVCRERKLTLRLAVTRRYPVNDRIR